MACSDKKFYGNIIPVTGGYTDQKDVVMIPGPGIKIEDLSTATQYKFRFSTEQVQDLSVDLTLVARSGGVVKNSPILLGTVIDELNLEWVYNKNIASQILANTGGLPVPSLGSGIRSYNYTGLSLQSNITLTIEGDDGLNQPGSIASDSESLSFGNYMYLGAGSSRVGQSAASLEAFIESLSGVIKTSRNHTYYASGVANQKHFVAYPEAWGEAVFTKGIFSGGYIRLKNVLGTLKTVLAPGDTELEIIFTNSAGHAEPYYVYESEYDNQADNITPFIIS